jgi:Acetyltransferase (GNAT) domain
MLPVRLRHPTRDGYFDDSVQITSPAPREEWRRVFDADADAVSTQSAAWLDCLCALRGWVDGSRFYQFPDGTRVVLPLARKKIGPLLLAEESWPAGWGYGGALVAGGRLTVRHAGFLLADLRNRPVARTALTPMPLSAGIWECAAPPEARRVAYETRLLDLRPGFTALWDREFRRQARNSVRKAQRCNLEIRREHGDAGVQTFDLLYRQSADRWARQRGYPRAAARFLDRRRNRTGQLAAVSGVLGDRCVIWSAHRAGEPVAVNVVLQSQRHCLGWLSAMNRELARLTLGTYLIQSLAIEDACRSGMAYFHMGESDPGSRAAHYKTYFGGVVLPYRAVRLERVPVTAAEQALRASATLARRWHRTGD